MRKLKKLKNWTLPFLILFLLAAILFLPTAVRADSVQTQTWSTGGDVVSILEIQPGRSFTLAASDLTALGASYGKTFSLTQMSMGEVISQVSDFDGRYDIILLGCNAIGDSYYMAGQNVGARSYFALGDAATNLPAGQSTTTYKEFYDHVDITALAAEKLETYITKNQLFVMDARVTNAALAGTNVQNLIAPYIRQYKVQTVDFTARAQVLESVGTWFTNATIAKRPTLSVTAPKAYSSTDATPYYLPTLSNGAKNVFVDFSVQSANAGSTIDANFYMDTNADGRYTANEMIDQDVDENGSHDLHGITTGTDYGFQYYLSPRFTGIVPWKLETVDLSTGVKSYVTGQFACKGNTLKLRVLHLTPGDKSTTLEIRQLGTLLNRSGEYDISVTQVTANAYNNAYPNTVAGYVGTATAATMVPTVLNGNYDMIIMGFADAAQYQISSATVAGEIKAFIGSGQSVMFTHDNFGHSTLAGSAGSWGYWLGYYFRDIGGQNPYYKDAWNTTINHAVSDGGYISAPVNGKSTYGFSDTTLYRSKDGSFPTTTTAYRANEGPLTQYPYTLGAATGNTLSIATTHYQYFRINLEDPELVPWFNLTGGGSPYNYNKYDSANNYYTYSKGNITYSGTGHSAPSGTPERQLFVNTIIKASRGGNHAPVLESVTGPSTGGNAVYSSQRSYELSFNAYDLDLDDDYLDGYITVDMDDTYSLQSLTTLGEEYVVYQHDAVSKANRVMNDVVKNVTIPVADASTNTALAPLADFIKKKCGTTLTNGKTFYIRMYVMDEDGAISNVKSFPFTWTVASTLSVDMDGTATGCLVNDVVPLEYSLLPVIPEDGNLSALYLAGSDSSVGNDVMSALKMQVSLPTTGLAISDASGKWTSTSDASTYRYSLPLANYVYFATGATSGTAWLDGVGKTFSASDSSTWLNAYGLLLRPTSEGNYGITASIGFDRYAQPGYRTSDNETITKTASLSVKTGHLTVTTMNANSAKVKTPMSVRIYKDGSTTAYATATTSNGIAEFDQVPTGSYRVVVSGTDFYSFEETDATRAVSIAYGDGSIGNYVKSLNIHLQGNVLDVLSFRSDATGDSTWQALEVNGTRAQKTFDATVRFHANTTLTGLSLGSLKLKDVDAGTILTDATISNVKLTGVIDGTAKTVSLTQGGGVWSLSGVSLANTATGSEYRLTCTVDLGSTYSANGDYVNGNEYQLLFGTFAATEASVDEPWENATDADLAMSIDVSGSPISQVRFSGRNGETFASVTSQDNKGTGFVLMRFETLTGMDYATFGVQVENAAGAALPSDLSFKLSSGAGIRFVSMPSGASTSASVSGSPARTITFTNLKAGSYAVLLRVDFTSNPTTSSTMDRLDTYSQFGATDTSTFKLPGVSTPVTFTHLDPATVKLVRVDIPAMN